MTNPQVPNSVSTSNGTYYLGMTKAQAEKQEIYSCFMGIDFKDLDTDKNGTLDQKEILQGMKKQAGRDKWFNRAGAILCYGVATSLQAFDLPSLGVTAAISVPLITGGTVCNFNKSEAEKREEEAQKHLDILQ